MNFHVAKAALTTGRLLETMVLENLRKDNIAIPADAHVCYGVGHEGNKVLNGKCSTQSKLKQAQLLQEGLGPGALQVFSVARHATEHLLAGKGPLFARTAVHSKGRDIKIALEPWQIEPLMAAGTAFFTAHEPSVKEFRTWVYRKRHLGTYEKVLRRPEACKRLGRNYDNGFDFSGIDNENVPQALKDISTKAIKLLGLDFGAVDVLQHPDGHFIVLEVNSAPGVSHERRKVICNLAHRIARWVANGCPDAKEG